MLVAPKVDVDVARNEAPHLAPRRSSLRVSCTARLVAIEGELTLEQTRHLHPPSTFGEGCSPPLPDCFLLPAALSGTGACHDRPRARCSRIDPPWPLAR